MPGTRLRLQKLMLLEAEFCAFGLPLTGPVTSGFKYYVPFRSVLSRTFVCRLANFAAATGSRITGRGLSSPPDPSNWWVAKYVSKCWLKP